MGTFIVEIRNPANDADRRLLVWSSRVDAPVTYSMTEAELTEYVRAELGESGVRDLPERLARVRDHGTSLPSTSWVHAISLNRAGPNETCLTPAEIWDAFADPPQEEPTQAEQPTMTTKIDTEPATVMNTYLTPAQQIALARIVQHAATYALVMQHRKEWNICNAVIDGNPLREALLNKGGLYEVFVTQGLELAKDLALFFDEAQLTEMARPADPVWKEALADGRRVVDERAADD